MHPWGSTWSPYGWALSVVSLSSVCVTSVLQMESEMPFIEYPMIHKKCNTQ